MVSFRSHVETRINFASLAIPGFTGDPFHTGVWPPYREWTEWKHKSFFGRGVVKVHRPEDYREVFEYFDPRFPDNVLGRTFHPTTLKCMIL